jgi:hypothetical protein
MSVSRSELRRIFEQTFKAEGLLDAFIIDYFIEVYEEFSAGMSRTEKINRLFVRIEPHIIEEILYAEYPEMFRQNQSTSPSENRSLSLVLSTANQLHSILDVIRSEDAEIEQVASIDPDYPDALAALRVENRQLRDLLLQKMLENDKLRTIINSYRKAAKLP